MLPPRVSNLHVIRGSSGISGPDSISRSHRGKGLLKAGLSILILYLKTQGGVKGAHVFVRGGS
jgi:hypothetical protein